MLQTHAMLHARMISVENVAHGVSWRLQDLNPPLSTSAHITAVKLPIVAHPLEQ